MSSNTKIVVLRSKELVYALVLLVVSVLIIMVAVSLFIPSKDSTDEKSAQPSPEVSSEVSSEASQGVSSDTPVDVNAGAGAIYTTDTYVSMLCSARMTADNSDSVGRINGYRVVMDSSIFVMFMELMWFLSTVICNSTVELPSCSVLE